jgi:hypothetical protein
MPFTFMKIILKKKKKGSTPMYNLLCEKKKLSFLDEINKAIC